MVKFIYGSEFACSMVEVRLSIKEKNDALTCETKRQTDNSVKLVWKIAICGSNFDSNKRFTPTMELNQFVFPSVNLSIYNSNPTGDCIVTSVDLDKAIDESVVFIIDIKQCFGINLYDEKLMLLEHFPTTPGEVFSVDLDEDGLHRVVCNEEKSLLFIDSGEIVHKVRESDFKMFSLSKRAQNLSARGMPCNVTEATDEFGKRIHDISEILHQQFSFTIHQIERGGLTVTLRKQQKEEKNDLYTQTNAAQFSQEELDMLYEEPEMTTTNALKAVYKFIPQDEKRICPFFDPKTGRCFKGNTCKLEHVHFLNGGLTRDRKVIKHKLNPGYTPAVGTMVKICITCIKSADEFYANIPEISARNMCDSLKDFKQKINDSTIVKEYKAFVGVPDPHDLVLIRHKDIFYRGRVIEDDVKGSLVFSVDYGFIQWFRPKDIFQWHPRWDFVPPYAFRCYLTNVQPINPNDEETTNAFRNLVLNGKDITARISAVTEDLYVELLDEDGFDIGETFCASGFAELSAKLIPSSTQFPG